MRKLTELFLIDGQPMLAPDADVALVVEDLEASDSGMDESAYYHRFVVRQGLGRWQFFYRELTEQEYAYVESLFAGKDSFQFTYPSAENGGVTAYRKKQETQWHSLNRLRNYQFTIVQC